MSGTTIELLKDKYQLASAVLWYNVTLGQLETNSRDTIARISTQILDD